MTKKLYCEVTLAIVVSICLGALNSIFAKIKADQLQIFDGLASGLMNAVGYCVGYVPMCYYRYRRGLVTPEMLEFMWIDSGGARRFFRGAHRFVVVGGFADDVGQICSSVAQPFVSIVAATLLGQTSSLWTVAASAMVLNARYTFQEFFGIAVALVGASIEVVDISEGNDKSTQFSMALLLLVAAAAPAVSFVFKEKCFRLYAAAKRRKKVATASSGEASELLGASDKQLDIWVVASAAAIWSLFWAPLVSLATSFIKKPGHLSFRRFAIDTFLCFSNNLDYADFIDDDTTDAHNACTVAWQWWLIYMVTNVAYNVSIYNVVRLASTLTSFVCGKLVTPLTIMLSLLPWPVIGRGSFSATQGLSLVVIFLGVVVFRLGTIHREKRFFSDANKNEACCWPLLRCRKSDDDDKPLLLPSEDEAVALRDADYLAAGDGLLVITEEQP